MEDMRKVKIQEDGYDIWVPEKDVVYTKIDGEIKTIHAIDKSYSIYEAEGLIGKLIDEQIKIMKAKRLEAKIEMKMNRERKGK